MMRKVDYSFLSFWRNDFWRIKALARTNIESHDAVIFDLSHVTMLDDTMTLSLENVILEALDMDKHVTVVVRTPEAKSRLLQVGLEKRMNDSHFVESRTEALERSLAFLHPG